MLKRKVIKYDWSRAIHKITLDHGETEYYANSCLLDEEKDMFRAILKSIDKKGLLPNDNPSITDILPIRKNSSFVFPFYEGCGIQMRKIFYVNINILNLIESGEREIITGSYNIADSVVNMVNQGTSFNDEEIERARVEYDPRKVSKLDDLMQEFAICSDVGKNPSADNIKRDEVEPYIVEMLIKGGVPREYITFPHHVRKWMEKEII